MAVEHYDYRSPETHADADVPHGAGYYRHAHAPPPDPLEQSRSILQQAAISILSQANTQPQAALTLLQG